MKRVVMFSGGIGSWATAKRVAAAHGTDDMHLLFADTLIEDADLYRFLDEAARDIFGNVEPRLIRLVEGRTPWQIFFAERFLGNSRVDPCSKILKRQIIATWLAENCDPADTVCYVGIDWSEKHRFEGGKGKLGLRARMADAGWCYEAPLCDAPHLTKSDHLVALDRAGIEPPRLYEWSKHNNCGGFCIKAGQGHFARLLQNLPEVYAHHERKEQEFRAFIGSDVSILTDRRGGEKKPLTMQAFRERIEAMPPLELKRLSHVGGDGGCGCFSDAEENT